MSPGFQEPLSSAFLLLGSLPHLLFWLPFLHGFQMWELFTGLPLVLPLSSLHAHHRGLLPFLCLQNLL